MLKYQWVVAASLVSLTGYIVTVPADTVPSNASATTQVVASQPNNTNTSGTSNNNNMNTVSANTSSANSSAGAAGFNNLNPSAAVEPPGSSSVRPLSLNRRFGLGEKSRLHVNGFMSAGSTRTTSSVPYGIPNYGEVKNKTNYNINSLVGLQLTVNLNHSFALVTQVVANGDNTNGNRAYSLDVDWAYLRFQYNNNYMVRAGRFRLPAFIYSLTQEVGYSYPWVFLPNEVYRIVPFQNINGVDMIYKQGLGNSGWSFTLQPYLGASNSEFDLYTSQTGNNPVPPGLTATFNENDMYGIVATMGNQYITFRGTYARLKLDGKVVFNGVSRDLLTDYSDSFYSAGVKLNYKNFVGAGEFAERDLDAPLASLQGWYAMIGYRWWKFLPNFTFAHIKTTNMAALNATTDAELPQAQQSYTYGLDYYINGNFVVKLEASDITPLTGTRGLFNTTLPSGVSTTWLYGIGLDAVF